MRVRRSFAPLAVAVLAPLGAIVGASAVGAPVAGAEGPPAAAQTFQVTNSGATVVSVGSSSFSPSSSIPAPLSGKTVAASLKTDHLRTPDIGKGDSVAGTPTPGGPGPHGPGSGAVPGAPVVGPTPGLMSIHGSNAYDQGILHPSATPFGLEIEPPDQGLCEGNGYTVELNNMVMQVFNSRTLQPVSGSPAGVALESIFKTPEIFGATGGPSLSIQGDPRCVYDPTSRHFFLSQLWLDEHNATPFGWAGTFVAVSQTTNPAGGWNIYFVPDQSNAQGIDGCNTTSNPCFGDQPLLGIDGNAIYIGTNEYTIFTATPPAGAANVYFLSKRDLLTGTTPSPIYWAHPGDTVAPGTPKNPWYSIVPANSDGAYVTAGGGTFYGLSNVTYTTTGGNQVAAWTFADTGAVTWGGTIQGSVSVYNSVSYQEPPMANQKAGPVPLANFWYLVTTAHTVTGPLPEGKIATNTDRVTTAAYDPASGMLWGALNTGVSQHGQTLTGIMWFAVPAGNQRDRFAPADGPHGGAMSGYVSAAGANVYFPGLTFTNTGQGLMDYSLSGTAFYPSTAYSLVGQDGPQGPIHMANPGVGPQDGFSEYQGYGTRTYRPRWGDYSTAVADGSTFYFADEMIAQSCSSSTAFTVTFNLTCTGTRNPFGNWGTSVSSLPARGEGGPGH